MAVFVFNWSLTDILHQKGFPVKIPGGKICLSLDNKSSYAVDANAAHGGWPSAFTMKRGS